MADILAAQNGNFNATTTWIGGVVPGVGDNAYANTRTVTITADVTCDKISTVGENGATGGGGFTVSTGGLTITANIEAGSTACLTCNVATLTVNGNCTGGTSASAHGFANTGTGTITILGNASGGTGGTAGGQICAGVLSQSGIVNITGTANGGSGGVGTHGIYVTGGIVNFTGDAIGGSGGNPGYGIISGSAGATVNMTGNATGGTRTGNAGAYNASTGVFNITGNVTGGVSSAYGAANASTGTFNITGIAYGSTSSGAYNASSGILRVTRAVGNNGGIANTGVGPVAGVTSNSVQSLTYVQQLEFGSSGASPTSGCIYLSNNTNNLVDFLLEGGGRKTVVDVAGASGFLPGVTDVRLGVSYNQGQSTGTCAVPAAGSVAFGVPVDNTTGTAAIDGASIRAALGLASANLDTQLAALPTAAENATAVWSEATRTITGGTVDTLTNAPDVPTEAEIAAEVWSAATREITGGTVTNLTNAPDVPTESEIADAVRTELTPELARLSNAATTQEVADIVEGAAALPEG